MAAAKAPSVGEHHIGLSISDADCGIVDMLRTTTSRSRSFSIYSHSHENDPIIRVISKKREVAMGTSIQPELGHFAETSHSQIQNWQLGVKMGQYQRRMLRARRRSVMLRE